MKTIWLQNGAKEQLLNCGINPWHQPIPYKTRKKSGYEEELHLHEDELCALCASEFNPEKVEDQIPEISERIKLYS